MFWRAVGIGGRRRQLERPQRRAREAAVGGCGEVRLSGSSDPGGTRSPTSAGDQRAGRRRRARMRGRGGSATAARLAAAVARCFGRGGGSGAADRAGAAPPCAASPARDAPRGRARPPTRSASRDPSPAPAATTSSNAAGTPGADLAHRRRLRVYMWAHSVASSFSRRYGGWPVERLEQHAAERVDVGARGDGRSLDLLRRRVVDRAHPRARRCVSPLIELACFVRPKSVR